LFVYNNMSNNQNQKDVVIGYITNISNENKKKKHYIKFTMISDNEKIIDGWIFSTNSGILTTPLGQALKSSCNNKTGIKIWGSLEENESNH